MSINALSPWQRFVRLLQLEKRDVLQILYYAIFAGLVSLSLPLGIQAIINLLQGAEVSSSWIVLVILVTIGVVFAGGLQLMQLRIIETIQQRLFMRASFEYSYRFPKIKMEEFRNFYPPELANRFFDTLAVQKGLSKILIDVPSALLQILFALILLAFYHPFFIFLGFLLLIFLYLVFKFTAPWGLQTSLEESKNKYKVAHWIQEVARSVVSFKLSGNTSLAMQKNDTLVAGYLVSREKHFKVLAIQFAQMITFKVLVTSGLLVIGGLLVLNQQMNIGQFVAAEIIILLVMASVEKLILGLGSLYDVLTSLEKLGQVVDKDLEQQDGLRPDFTKQLVVELQDASYVVDSNKAPVLDRISLTISQGDRVLVQGESGAGKSSLLRLISGIITHTSGNVYVNGQAMEGLYLNHYRANLGLSLSEEAPFEGTIRENISFGNPEISDEQIFWAMEKTGLTKFLREQRQGLDTMLFPEGRQISYTNSKKIVLARAIAKKPRLLVLEDPLDHFNEEESVRIIDFLTDPAQEWSLIVVSSNRKWEDKCHKVVSLEEGKLFK